MRDKNFMKGLSFLMPETILPITVIGRDSA